MIPVFHIHFTFFFTRDGKYGMFIILIREGTMKKCIFVFYIIQTNTNTALATMLCNFLIEWLTFYFIFIWNMFTILIDMDVYLFG